MVDISNELNEAFEKSEREIKAYAVVKYGKPTTRDNIDNIGLRITSCSPQKADISNINSMVKKMDYSKPIYTDYTTLEVDRTRLNGNFILPEFDEEDSEYNYAGYISENLAEQNTVLQVYASVKDEQQQYLIEEPFSGITLFFKDNIPRYVGLQMVVDEETIVIDITDNEKEMVNIDFEENLLPNQSITITATNWERTDRRIRLQRIELGHTEIYENEDIVDMEITEQVKKFCEETPENECKLTINKKINILDNMDIVNLFEKNGTIIPYIGAVKEDNTIEYVNMGKFYYDTYNSDENTLTIIGKNIIKKFKKMDLIGKDGIDGPIIRNDISNKTMNYLKEVYDLESYIEPNDSLGGMSSDVDRVIDSKTSLLNYLQMITIVDKDILKIDRNEKINIIPFNYEIKKTIDDSLYIEKPKIKKIKKINTIKLDFSLGRAYSSVGDDSNKEELIINHILENNIDIIKIGFNDKIGVVDLPTNITGGDVQIREWNANMIFYKATGNIGDTVSFKQNVYKMIDKKNVSMEYVDEENIIEENKNKIEINGDLIFYPSTQYEKDFIKNRFCNHYFNNASEYETEFYFNGNPALEAGDVVNLETEGTSINIFIENIVFKYDGGLTSYISGVDMKGE